MFQRRSSQRTSGKVSPLSTTFHRVSCTFSPQVRISALLFFDHTAPIDIRSDPPTSNAAPSDPQGQVPDPFSFPLSKVNATKLSGGSVKIVDSTTFKISTRIAVADVTVEPGAIRELHVGVSAFFFGCVVALISAMAYSGTRHKTSGFMFCNETPSNFPGMNFDTEASFLGKAMAA